MPGIQDIGGVLLVYNRPVRILADASTVREHINAFRDHSAYPVFELNTSLGFPPGLTNFHFDAIVVHYSVFAAGPYSYLLDQGTLDYLESAEDSYKVAFFQDEYHWCGRRFTFLDQYGFDCVYTCVEAQHFEQTYGRYTQVPKLVSHIPGYVSKDLIEAVPRYEIPESERTVDVGYRGRPLPPHLGRGAMEKNEIGRRFAELAANSGLRLDIDLTEEGRLYGDHWYEFVANCRGMLGVESGASCYDLEDEVLHYVQQLEAAAEPVTIEALESGPMKKWDGKIPIRTISPRHFEAAAFGVTQILFEGGYSGAMQPMEHYIPLKKDFSNLDQVLALFGDPEVRRRLTANARRDLIDSGTYGYERLIESFDHTLAEAGLEPPQALEKPRASVQAAMRRRPLPAVFVHYVNGFWGWLKANHPIPWTVLHYASRPVVWPLKWAHRGVRRRQVEDTAAP